MNRRGFLSALASAAGLLVVDPEKLLWTPTKTIFIPSGVELAHEPLTNLATIYYERKALDMLKKRFMFAEYLDIKPKLLRHGKQVDFFRYSLDA